MILSMPVVPFGTGIYNVLCLAVVLRAHALDTDLDSGGTCIKGVGSSNHCECCECECECAMVWEEMSYVDHFHRAASELYLIAKRNGFGRNMISG